MLSPYKIAKISKYLIYFTLFLPLVIVPFTLWEYVFVRNLIFYCLTAVLLLLGLLYLYKNKHNVDFKISSLFWVIFCFVVIRIISGIFGIDSHNSFFGSQFRMDGNLCYIMLFAWLLSLLLFFKNHEDWLKLFKVSAIVALFASIFAVIQAFFPSDFGALSGKGATPFFNHRLIGSFGNPILLSGYLLPHIFLSLYLALKEKSKKMKYFWLILSFIFIVIILLTRTRGAILSLTTTSILLGGISIFYLIRCRKKVVLKKMAIFGTPLLALAAVIFANTGLVDRLTNFSFSSGTVVTRLMLWKIGISAFLDKWLLGWGPENFSYAFSKFYNPIILNFSFYETWADKPHNQIVEIAVASGILGLVAFLCIVLFSLSALWRLIKKDKNNFLPHLLIGGIIISYFIHIFFAFDTLELRFIFFIILGYIIFLLSDVFTRAYKLSISLLRGLVLILLIVAIFSLNAIGVKTIYASYYASRAIGGIVNNQYADAKLAFNKLKDIDTPYKNGNWELLADAVLKSDAIGKLPKITIKEILPVVIRGLEVATEEQEENFSYHYRLGQMYNLAGVYIDEKYFDKAIVALEKAKKISPKRQVSNLSLAQIYYHKREVETGIKLLEELVEQSPDISELYWHLGLFYGILGDSEKSYAYMATAVDKRYVPKTLNEAIIYIGTLGKFNDYSRMEPIYEEIIKKDSNNARWWANIAVIYLELGKYEKARNATRQAIFLDSKFGDEGEDFLKKIDEMQNQ
ncbi:O-antigen ligase family protein [Patescibacteria group bacterium]